MKTIIKNIPARAKNATFIIATPTENNGYEFFYATDSVVALWKVLNQYKANEVAVFHKNERK